MQVDDRVLIGVDQVVFICIKWSIKETKSRHYVLLNSRATVREREVLGSWEKLQLHLHLQQHRRPGPGFTVDGHMRHACSLAQVGFLS